MSSNVDTVLFQGSQHPWPLGVFGTMGFGDVLVCKVDLIQLEDVLMDCCQDDFFFAACLYVLFLRILLWYTLFATEMYHVQEALFLFGIF